jgi:hypothetical protein
MPRSVLQSLSLVVLATSVTVSPAHAKPFDLIYTDQVHIALEGPMTGFSYDRDIGIVVNRGPTQLSASELASATFSASSSDPNVSAVVWIDDASLGGPMVPNEAVGSVGCASQLRWLLYPSEILRNMIPTGVMWLSMGFPEGYSDAVSVIVTMRMGSDVANYLVTFDFSSGEEFVFSVQHATRVSSTAVTGVGTNSGGGVRLAPVPNPGTEAFELGLPDAADVEVALYDMKGRRVTTLLDRALPAGKYTLNVPDRNRLSSGMYVARADVRMPGRSVERVAKAIVVH